ncbi:Bifunctional hemolysin/adenylate cyclase [Methylobacterium bullatum]|uniref:Bifunctional hemolysin/adenylate cyclase n=1 Tax=Methylobacterium bullatum TaxID=570505 RepID=A0A679J6Q2_9HYPH|nr:Bifunctional hemolysin/adenylate cyclase [Methylobacterium bullatum]
MAYVMGTGQADLIDYGTGVTDEKDYILGYSGNDVIYGRGGDDTIFGDSDSATNYIGSDTLYGGGGNDLLIGDNGVDTLYGGSGDDRFVMRYDLFVDDVYGQSGTDTLAFFAFDRAANVNLSQKSYFIVGGEEGKQTVSGVENVSGTDQNDKLTGDAANNLLSGNIGDDQLNGGAGNDTLQGGDGVDRVVGASGDDVLSGDGSSDKLFGGEGKDVLNGGTSDDALFGDAGNDSLRGDDGNDTLIGGAGNDRLTGGSGRDTFVFDRLTGKDVITDFSPGSGSPDVIRLEKDVLGSFAALVSHAEDTSAGVVIHYDEGSIRLAGLHVADLHATDFLFV